MGGWVRRYVSTISYNGTLPFSVCVGWQLELRFRCYWVIKPPVKWQIVIHRIKCEEWGDLGAWWGLVVCGRRNGPTTPANHQHQPPTSSRPTVKSQQFMFCNLNWTRVFTTCQTGQGGLGAVNGHKLTDYNIIIWREGGREGGGKTDPVQLWLTSCMENPMIKMLIPSLDNKMKTTHSVKKS